MVILQEPPKKGSERRMLDHRLDLRSIRSSTHAPSGNERNINKSTCLMANTACFGQILLEKVSIALNSRQRLGALLKRKQSQEKPTWNEELVVPLLQVYGFLYINMLLNCI